jgi:hypothetical protein
MRAVKAVAYMRNFWLLKTSGVLSPLNLCKKIHLERREVAPGSAIGKRGLLLIFCSRALSQISRDIPNYVMVDVVWLKLLVVGYNFNSF